MKKFMIGLFVLVLAMFLVACGSDSKDKEKEAVETETNSPVDTTFEISDEEKLDKDEVVVTVNGVDVKGSTYNVIYTQLKMYASQTGEEVDIDEVKDSTIESLIDRELVLQEAEQEGLVATEDVVNTEFEIIKSTNEEGLATLLAQYDLTEEGFKDELQFELTMKEYMDMALGVSVSEDEVKEFYDEAKEETDEVPDYDDVKEQLMEQMKEQKKQAALQEKIVEMKEKAQIERKI